MHEPGCPSVFGRHQGRRAARAGSLCRVLAEAIAVEEGVGLAVVREMLYSVPHTFEYTYDFAVETVPEARLLCQAKAGAIGRCNPRHAVMRVGKPVPGAGGRSRPGSARAPGLASVPDRAGQRYPAG
jgi:hypothetical protein